MSRATGNDSRPHTIVLGAGSGGLTVAVGLSRLGRRVMLLEADRMGGDCTNVGCIPSKSLLHHASSRPVERAAGRPVDAATAQTVGRSAAIFAAVRRRRDELREHEVEEFGSTDGIDLVFGRGRLLGPGRVEITGEPDRPVGSSRVVEADHVVLATGSRPRRFDVDGLAPELVVTNEELFELDDRPDHLLVVGGGAIGLEMAVAFCDLGSRVTVVEAAPRIMATMLPEASDALAGALVRRGIDIRPGAVVVRATAAADGSVGFEIGPPGGAATEVVDGVDRVLMAVGRVPNTEGLGLETAGVALDAAGRVVVDDRGRTNVERVWACGDVTDRGGTTHGANAWGRRIIKHILAPIAPAGAVPAIPAAAFTDPEVATIGAQPEQVPDDVRRLRVDLADVDRGYTDEVAEGFVIVDVRRLSGKILGATVVGPRAGEMISIVALAMNAGVRLHTWYGTVWPYPTYAGAFGQLVDQYMAETLTGIPGELGAWVRGRLRR